ncbi:hypothetical protein ENSA5_50320 [Enhygromyxa salina]|uniref:Uncharacterized protein n=1 Tax=Enhygromyxa salina TaxID=215803 RepID=A0A2S9XHL3_9BACT|nr:hypothetical protein [Enhygromyxa salina]PRP92230.1 hypothetical protein ENSA5_50320 [Enhygromyxa salina]
MAQPSDRFQVLTWAEFDEFWRALEASHEQTPYTFDAYDEEVARIAFKAGRESMRRQVVAMVEHMLESNRAAPLGLRVDPEGRPATAAEISRAVLREIADDVSSLIRAEDN